MLVAEVIIPQMFTAYAEDLGYRENGLHHYQYFCKNCNQAFSAAWGRKDRAMGWCERGDYFHCPHCGTRHDKNVAYIKRQLQAPNAIRLCVKIFENVVTFEAYSDTVQFQDLLRVFGGSYKEIFRFDLAKQTVLFSRYDNGYKIESMEIGDPFKLDVLEKSILDFFLPNSLANSSQKAELNKILKVLRETVHRQLEKRLGHKVSSMFVNSGQYHGTFLLPIFNIAYRVRFPDAPNLPVTYRENAESIQRFWEMRMIFDPSFMNEVMALIKRKTDFVTAMARANSLPDGPMVRRILSEDPFEVGMLSEAFALCQNYDYAIRLYYGFKKLKSNKFANAGLLQFLQTMLPIYGEAGIVHLVEAAKELELRDCISLHQQLNEEGRQAIQIERVKLKDLHDWMALRHQKQNHKNLKFDVPDHIIKRLSMQTNRLKFFMPQESMELLEAGVELHNCVASYGAAMRDNSKWIVLVADDKGKLAACLEVKGKELVQAKINRNKPVSSDDKLNREVVAWAREAKLKIKTEDLKVETEEKIQVAV